MPCSYCRGARHTIRNCQNPDIENTWNAVLSQVNLDRQFLGDDDLHYAKLLLNDTDSQLVAAIGIRYANTLVRDSTEQQVAAICERIKREAIHFVSLDAVQRQEYLHRIEPNGYFLDEAEDFVPQNLAQEYFRYEDGVFEEEVEEIQRDFVPMLLCMETQEELSQRMECAICYDEHSAFNTDTLQCQHSFCHCCVITILKQKKNHSCPLCRADIRTVEVKDMDKYDDIIFVKLFMDGLID